MRQFVWLLACIAACACGTSCAYDRAPCARDRECALDEVCWHDGRCLRRDLAERLGGQGAQCGHDDEGCVVPGFCVGGRCTGEPADAGPRPVDAALDLEPPAFDGLAAAYPDGDGALLVYWHSPSDDLTATAALEVLLYRGTAPGGQDFSTPVAVVTGQRWFHDAGRATGATYYYVAAARDAAGNVTFGPGQVSATAQALPPLSPGIDFADQVQPIFAARCVMCHGGTSALYLDTHAHVRAGGLHGPVVVPCRPELSTLGAQIGPLPPFGWRMPRSGPPFLSMTEQAVIRRWIADGAEERYDPRTCDVTAPLFAGAVSAVATSGASCRVTWSPASDAVSPPAAVRYRVYRAAAAGAQDYATATAESLPGATAIDLIGLVTGVTVYLVVRAVDEAGNEDENTQERACTPP